MRICLLFLAASLVSFRVYGQTTYVYSAPNGKEYQVPVMSEPLVVDEVTQQPVAVPEPHIVRLQQGDRVTIEYSDTVCKLVCKRWLSQKLFCPTGILLSAKADGLFAQTEGYFEEQPRKDIMLVLFSIALMFFSMWRVKTSSRHDGLARAATFFTLGISFSLVLVSRMLPAGFEILISTMSAVMFSSVALYACYIYEEHIGVYYLSAIGYVALLSVFLWLVV